MQYIDVMRQGEMSRSRRKLCKSDTFTHLKLDAPLTKVVRAGRKTSTQCTVAAADVLSRDIFSNHKPGNVLFIVFLLQI